MLRIAIQSKGRLNEDSMSLLAEVGIKVEPSKRKLLTHCPDFPIEVLYLRDDDIPQAVEMGVADVGIVGLNEVIEKNADVALTHHLGFSKCRISLAIPKNEVYQGVKYFEGKRIATSYEKILKDFFEKEGINAYIHSINGSVEIAPSIGLADGIFDIVSSGSTLISNGLVEVEKVFFSEAVLISNHNLSTEKQTIVDEILFRIQSVERSRGKKYLVVNAPEEKIDAICSILPGMKSPTVVSHAQQGWCSLQVVVNESELWEKIKDLKQAGAEDILVLSLEKIIP